ncbi:hypothetical protein [Desulfonatronum thioautotrophicum]|uniref:hypothetical protein n=1 Tax=Desulfonatronum thioautotrophicum TaxID=617001 RepID=UPI00129487BC|nr:hypothetical protein [Desulfonatronum thioautotrophicum]
MQKNTSPKWCVVPSSVHRTRHRPSDRFPHTLLLLALILLLGPATICLAGQDVRIFVEADDAGVTEPRPAAVRQALAQGVAQEAQTLLPDGLSEPRRAILKTILEARAQEYVLGWEEKEYQRTEWGAVLRLNVDVNRDALRAFIQSLGLTSPRSGEIGYHLEAQGLGADQLASLQDLEVLSGLRRDGSQELILRLAASGDGSWQGVLDHAGRVWTASGSDLLDVWAGLWGNYFRLDQVRQGTADTLTLVTTGWQSAGDIQDFDRHLRGLGLSMDRIVLRGFAMQGDSYEATWQIQAADRGVVEHQLRQFFEEEAATFSME